MEKISKLKFSAIMSTIAVFFSCIAAILAIFAELGKLSSFAFLMLSVSTSSSLRYYWTEYRREKQKN